MPDPVRRRIQKRFGEANKAHTTIPAHSLKAVGETATTRRADKVTKKSTRDFVAQQVRKRRKTLAKVFNSEGGKKHLRGEGGKKLRAVVFKAQAETGGLSGKRKLQTRVAENARKLGHATQPTGAKKVKIA